MTRKRTEPGTYIATLRVELATTSPEYAHTAARDLAALLFADGDVNAVACNVPVAGRLDPDEEAA